MQDVLRQIPGVDKLLAEPEIEALLEDTPRSVVVKSIRIVLGKMRERLASAALAAEGADASLPAIISLVSKEVERLSVSSYRRVVNATGVVIHTNLGRSLLAPEALEAIQTAGKYYTNLEFNLAGGARGSRYSHVEELLCDLTGAESALVVNNNAAAVLLVLKTLADGKEVIVSRGELVEIGGSFRIPEVMASSGALMVEVGATNKTHLKDYEQAVTGNTAVLMKVHQSNFHIIGFTQQVDAADLVNLARQKGLMVVEDLGSGALTDFSVFGLGKEPTVRQVIDSGVDLACFSGDKLLGGPQAGILIGKESAIKKIKTNPLNRALRIDKFTLAALEATLRLYLDPDKALKQIPVLKMITMDYRAIRRRAAALKRKILNAAEPSVNVELRDGASRIGGGAMPLTEMKTKLVCLSPKTMAVTKFEEIMRLGPVPIIGRIENDRFIIDPRTMNVEDERIVVQALSKLED